MKRTDDQSLLSGHGGKGIGSSVPAASSQRPEHGWAKHWLVGERHGPAAAWRTTGSPAGEEGEEGELEDQERLGPPAVTCHGATATARLGHDGRRVND
jgi:hypothetical protein